MKILSAIFKPRSDKDKFELVMELAGEPDRQSQSALEQSAHLAFRDPPFRDIEIKLAGRAVAIRGAVHARTQSDAVQLIANASFRVWHECRLKDDGMVTLGGKKTYFRHGIA